MKGFNFYFFFAFFFVLSLINVDLYVIFRFNRFIICWVEFFLVLIFLMFYRYGKYFKVILFYISVYVVYNCTIYRVIFVLFWFYYFF